MKIEQRNETLGFNTVLEPLQSAGKVCRRVRRRDCTRIRTQSDVSGDSVQKEASGVGRRGSMFCLNANSASSARYLL